MKHIRLMQKAFNTPLLLDPAYAHYVFSYLAGREKLGAVISPDQTILNPSEYAESYQMTRARFQKTEEGVRYNPYSMFGDVAVVTIEGSLVDKMGSMEPYSGMMGYDAIKAKLDHAQKNPSVKGVVLSLDTPGGMVTGIQSLSKAIAKFTKPLYAHADTLAASAGYWIASQAQKVFADPESQMGSIGVVMAHVDQSKQLEQEGKLVTLIYSGEHKVDGNPYQTLPTALAEKWKKEVDVLRGQFAENVAAGRGARLTKQMALDTEARMYSATESVAEGLADQVAELDEVITIMQSAIRGSVTLPVSAFNNESKTMTHEIEMVSLADAQATAERAAETARGEGVKAGATQERARIKAILGSDAAKGKQSLAQTMAFETDMSAEQAAMLLGAAAEESNKSLSVDHSAKMAELAQGANLPIQAVPSAGEQAAARKLQLVNLRKSQLGA